MGRLMNVIGRSFHIKECNQNYFMYWVGHVMYRSVGHVMHSMCSVDNVSYIAR